jgi:Saxitoxin biosynthesis operon protein SxtJ
MTAAAHETYVEYRSVDPPSDRRFGLTVGILLLALVGARWALGRFGSADVALMIVAGLLLTLAIVAPRALSPINRAWMRLGFLLAAVVNPVVMAVMFALVFAPIAIVTRAAGRDVLKMKRTPASKSYWASAEASGDAAARLKDQF